MKRTFLLWFLAGLFVFGVTTLIPFTVEAGSATLETDRRGQAIQGALAPMVAQSISFDAATSNGTAFVAPIVRVTATTACFIRFGAAATGSNATTSYHYMGAGTTEYFKTRGLGYISAIKSTVAGTLYISEME